MALLWLGFDHRPQELLLAAGKKKKKAPEGKRHNLMPVFFPGFDIGGPRLCLRNGVQHQAGLAGDKAGVTGDRVGGSAQTGLAGFSSSQACVFNEGFI